jgi:DNA polymerase IV
MTPLFLHIDGDGFFASCEVAKHPELTGKPVVVGRERGMAIAMNYPAKWLGVTRGMPIYEITKRFPSVVVRDADHESYAYFSGRMNDILARYTSHIERYSVDESFAEIADAIPPDGDVRAFAKDLSDTLVRELGMTFSIGIGPTKVLAKLGSRKNKPRGITIIDHSTHQEHLASTPIGDVWGIGNATAHALSNMGISTAQRFVMHPLPSLRMHFPKPIIALWHELSGTSVLPLATGSRLPHQSILRTRTFTRPMTHAQEIIHTLIQHIEILTSRLRHEGLVAGSLTYALLTTDRRMLTKTLTFLRPIDTPSDMITEMRRTLPDFDEGGVAYKRTSVTLSHLTVAGVTQPDLWDVDERAEARRKVFAVLDTMNIKKGGAHLSLASSPRVHASRIRGHDASESRTWVMGIPDLGDVM